MNETSYVSVRTKASTLTIAREKRGNVNAKRVNSWTSIHLGNYTIPQNTAYNVVTFMYSFSLSLFNIKFLNFQKMFEMFGSIVNPPNRSLTSKKDNLLFFTYFYVKNLIFIAESGV